MFHRLVHGSVELLPRDALGLKIGVNAIPDFLNGGELLTLRICPRLDAGGEHHDIDLLGFLEMMTEDGLQPEFSGDLNVLYVLNGDQFIFHAGIVHQLPTN